MKLQRLANTATNVNSSQSQCPHPRFKRPQVLSRIGIPRRPSLCPCHHHLLNLRTLTVRAASLRRLSTCSSLLAQLVRNMSVSVWKMLTMSGATIIVVMIILALYTMRKRGLTFKDVMQQGKNRMHRKPVPPPKYGMDNKQSYGNNSPYARTNLVQPQPATTSSRKGSLSSQAPLQPLARSDRYVEIFV